jgi:hypothetical protein
MKNKKVVSHKQRLDALFDKVEALDNDPELIAHWSRYLCVLVSGFIEASLRTILTDYVSARSSPECNAPLELDHQKAFLIDILSSLFV